MTETVLSIDYHALLQKYGWNDPAELQKRRAQAQAEERQNHIYEQERYIDAPAHWTLDNFDGGRWPVLMRAIAEIKTGKRFSLLLTGETNSGKSHALCAIARYLAGEVANPSAPGDDQRYMTVFRLKEHDLYPLWDTSRYRQSESFDAMIQRARNADALVYDDLGKVEWARGNYALTPFGCVVFSVFDARAEARKINLVSSRYEDYEALQRAIGVDAVRRIVQAEAGAFRARIIKRD